MCIRDSFKRPVILTDYPKEIKAFYMKQNEDGKTVRAMDVLFPVSYTHLDVYKRQGPAWVFQTSEDIGYSHERDRENV